MAKVVICKYCNQKFDRDREQYSYVGSRRYAHAACMLRQAEIDPKFKVFEIVDPLDNVTCVYCKKPMSRKDEDCVYLDNGKYAHKACQEIEQTREKTDKEKLEDYIKKLFNTDYVYPRIKKQIEKFIKDYNYTYSGIHKSLLYFYEIKHGDITKAHDTISIVPYVYKDSYEYFYNLWLAQAANKDKKIETYVPKTREVYIPRPQVKIKKRKLFSFLDEEDK